MPRNQYPACYMLKLWGGLSREQEKALPQPEYNEKRLSTFEEALELQDRVMAQGCAKSTIYYLSESRPVSRPGYPLKWEQERLPIRTHFKHSVLIRSEAARLDWRMGGGNLRDEEGAWCPRCQRDEYREGYLELLAALEDIVDNIECYCDDHNSDRPTDVTVALPRLKEAIAKANRRHPQHAEGGE